MNTDNSSIKHLGDTINLKLIFLKILRNWYWYLLLLIVGIYVARYFNRRRPNVYELDTLLTVKDENNPYFTTNMSLVFNWGGVSDKVNTIITTFKSRSHNEDIVRKLKLYIDYFEKGKYYDIDIYGRQPFEVVLNDSLPQAVGIPFRVEFTSPDTFIISAQSEKASVSGFNFGREHPKALYWPEKKWKGEYHTGQWIDSPVFHGKIRVVRPKALKLNHPYYFKLHNFFKTVQHYQNLYVNLYKKNTSMIVLRLKGHNKKKIEDYLNTSVATLKEKLLRDKNSFATNTIRFIDSTLRTLKKDLAQSSKRLEDFQRNKKEFALDNPSEALYNQLLELDQKKSALASQKVYYQTLRSYLENNRLEDIPSPSIVGIDDPLIVDNTRQLTALAIQRKEMEKILSPSSIPLQELNNKIANTKKALLTAVESALYNLQQQQNFVQRQITRLEQKLNVLPSELKQFIDLKRDFEVKDQIYSYLLQKRNEVDIVKASNKSAIKILDPAKDIGQAPVAPNRRINYLLALLAALLIPTLVILIAAMLDTRINDVEELKTLTPLRILGTIFHSSTRSKLPVLQEDAGAQIRESFSTLRTNVRFQLPQNMQGGRVLIITSSTSGEGKTFVSGNLAAMNALSNQKAVLLEFDIRRPKSVGYFEQVSESHAGITDFISDESLDLEHITQKSELENLDVIVSGHKNVNESSIDISGLLENERVNALFRKLREKYDVIIVDSPPLGLVPDALILNQYADYMLYIVRENYTKKNMLSIINDYYQNGEIKKAGIVYNDYKINLIKRYGYDSKYAYSYKKYGYRQHKSKGFNLLNIFKRFLRK